MRMRIASAHAKSESGVRNEDVGSELTTLKVNDRLKSVNVSAIALGASASVGMSVSVIAVSYE
jgi:hypothetical protein